MKIQIFKELF